MADEPTKKIDELDEQINAPADTDLMILQDTVKTRKITFQVIADTIKEKMFSWTFAALTTTAKTLVESINEIFSKIVYTKSVANVTDLNITDNGLLVIPFSYLNCAHTPCNYGVLLHLAHVKDANIWVQQLAFDTSSLRVFCRRKTNDTDWADWDEILFKAKQSQSQIQEGFNGVYLLNTTISASNQLVFYTPQISSGGAGNTRQTIFIFGSANGIGNESKSIHGMITIDDGTGASYSGNGSITVTHSGTRVVATLPNQAYDEFVLISGKKITAE